MSRLLAAVCAAVVSVSMSAGVAVAEPKGSPAPAQSAQAGDIVSGRVTNVDYQRGVVSVEDESRRTVEVSVTPTTSVQAEDPGYHAISDVSRGSRVQIFTARNAGKLVAQIIRLIKR